MLVHFYNSKNGKKSTEGYDYLRVLTDTFPASNWYSYTEYDRFRCGCGESIGIDGLMEIQEYLEELDIPISLNLFLCKMIKKHNCEYYLSQYSRINNVINDPKNQVSQTEDQLSDGLKIVFEFGQ